MLGSLPPCSQTMLSHAGISLTDAYPAMVRRLPPLNALRTFEAAARHESFTRAAEELAVTQGAVSQQIKALELALGVRLFTRAHQKLSLTEPGRQYQGVVRDALDSPVARTECEHLADLCLPHELLVQLV